MIDGKTFYNPITDKVVEKHLLTRGDCLAKSEKIQNWVNKESERIKGFPGYDGIESFLDYASDTAHMLKQHHIEQQKQRNQDMSESKEKSRAGELTGLLKQFDEMKKKHPDAVLLFRVGDFYESYRQDAEKVAKICDINTVTRKTGGEELKLAGFPHHALDTYLPKLVRAGTRVAICEQLEDPKLRKKEEKKETVRESTKSSKSEENKNESIKQPQMPRKKKEETVMEAPVATKTKKQKTEVKTEQKSEKKQEQTQAQEAKTERKPREPQMVTVNGDKVTHGHAFQSTLNNKDWYFTAKINGEQLKPQKMDPADLAAFKKKEIAVPQLMEKYYPTKLMERVPEVAFKTPNVIAGPNGNLTVDKFNVYKEKDETKQDHGKYKFYAQVGDQKKSTVPSKQDLNAYFDRVMTPGQLVEKNFGERLHLKSAYDKYQVPEEMKPGSARVAKDRNDGKWYVSADLGEKGKTSKKEITFDDGYSLFKAKTVTREQLAVKHLGDEIKTMLSNPVKQEKSQSMKI